MKQQIKKWTLRLTVTAVLIAALLLVIVLNPILTYAHQTKHKGFTVFHNQPLAPAISKQLDQANVLLHSSEFYTTPLALDICLNDGSKYPQLMQAIRGRAFAWGFYDKVVLQGNADYTNNTVELNGYKWNLTQLLAHEMMHCLQYAQLGFWKSKPVADIAAWKWEGYAEYIARQDGKQKDLSENISRFIQADKTDKTSWGIGFADNTITPREYYIYWLLVQYCMDIKKMTYKEILADSTDEEVLRNEMMSWYNKKSY